MQSPLVVPKRVYRLQKCEKEATFFMASQVMRITLKAYDHELVDSSAKKIIEVNEECQVSDEKFFSIKLSFIKLSYSTYTFSY